ncbi:hypothetical protein TSAR_003409 [Trichomalopsis sarcophagae]|uniref:Uncharacterized protein n=1 Tax=Trichomalopsis sarcophagae TaxID=543379 RepID=A0A232FHP6_9HYME|nr:hypothetical protein TSAR_003409 [Trichomalopsis sarcophagae]
MDASDRDQLNQDIDAMYQRTANISALAAQQTHIVKSNLESMHEELVKDKMILHQQHQQLPNIINKTSQLQALAELL